MKEPIPEWAMVCDLMNQIEHLNLNITPNSEAFVEELYNLLDPFAPFLGQRSEKQLKWLKDLWETHCNLPDIQLEDF